MFLSMYKVDVKDDHGSLPILHGASIPNQKKQDYKKIINDIISQKEHKFLLEKYLPEVFPFSSIIM